MSDERIDPVFEKQSIHDARVFVSEYQVHLGSLSTRITIRVYQSLQSGQFEWGQSHYIHTPDQIGPYMTSINTAPDEASALRRAISTLTDFYDGAVSKKKHEPSDDWLVENDDFGR